MRRNSWSTVNVTDKFCLEIIVWNVAISFGWKGFLKEREEKMRSFMKELEVEEEYFPIRFIHPKKQNGEQSSVMIQIYDSTSPWPRGCSFDCVGLIDFQRLGGYWLFSLGPWPGMETKGMRQHLDWATGWCGHAGTLSCCYLVPISQHWWCIPELLGVSFEKRKSMPNSPRHSLLDHFLLLELPIWPHFDLESSSRPSSDILLPQQSCSSASWQFLS